MTLKLRGRIVNGLNKVKGTIKQKLRLNYSSNSNSVRHVMMKDNKILEYIKNIFKYLKKTDELSDYINYYFIYNIIYLKNKFNGLTLNDRPIIIYDISLTKNSNSNKPKGYSDKELRNQEKLLLLRNTYYHFRKTKLKLAHNNLYSELIYYLYMSIYNIIINNIKLSEKNNDKIAKKYYNMLLNIIILLPYLLNFIFDKINNYKIDIYDRNTTINIDYYLYIYIYMISTVYKRIRKLIDNINNLYKNEMDINIDNMLKNIKQERINPIKTHKRSMRHLINVTRKKIKTLKQSLTKKLHMLKRKKILINIKNNNILRKMISDNIINIKNVKDKTFIYNYNYFKYEDKQYDTYYKKLMFYDKYKNYYNYKNILEKRNLTEKDKKQLFKYTKEYIDLYHNFMKYRNNIVNNYIPPSIYIKILHDFILSIDNNDVENIGSKQINNIILYKYKDFYKSFKEIENTIHKSNNLLEDNYEIQIIQKNILVLLYNLDKLNLSEYIKILIDYLVKYDTDIIINNNIPLFNSSHNNTKKNNRSYKSKNNTKRHNIPTIEYKKNTTQYENNISTINDNRYNNNNSNNSSNFHSATSTLNNNNNFHSANSNLHIHI